MEGDKQLYIYSITGNISPSVQFDGFLERGCNHQSMGLREWRVRTNPEGAYRLRSGHRL